MIWLERISIGALYSKPMMKNMGVRILRLLGWRIKTLNIMENNIYELIDDKNDTILFTRRGRIRRYKKGINKKIQSLQDEYLTQRLDIRKESIVLDIGANIGEFSKYWSDKGHLVVAFEPDSREYMVLRQNNEMGVNHNIGLWDTNKVLRFYLNNESGDSSFLPKNESDNFVDLEVNRLDDMGLEDEDIGLIKLEAEGAEPEIINGGLTIFRKAQFVSVDVGEERGSNRESTMVDVLGLMIPLGFNVIAYNPSRQSLLFQNRKKV